MIWTTFVRAAVFGVTVGVLAQLASAATPLNDLGSGLYLGQYEGGLYPNGSNIAPAAHAAEGIARAATITPLNALGQSDPITGKYILLSLGMSNTTQEFAGGDTSTTFTSYSFMGQAAAHPAVNHSSLVIFNGARGGQSAATWDSPLDSNYDRVKTDLQTAGYSEAQVQAVWVKEANPGPTASLPSAQADAYTLVQQLGNTTRALKVRYPNLQEVFFSSRIYAGYSSTTLNPEPYAYESGLGVKWLIESQINQMAGGTVDARAGDLNYGTVAPWVGWGPYLWADGTNPRSDGLTWIASDFVSDGTHPNTSARAKVGGMLLDFLLHSDFSKAWFVNSSAAVIPGDANNDGRVDGRDLLALARNWHQWGNWSMGDFDANGFIDGHDLGLLSQNWQVGTGAPAVGQADVPEPGRVLLLGAAAAICARRRRNKNH